MQRGREIRRRTAIYAVTGRGLARHLLECRAHGLLHRMINLDIVRPRPQVTAQRQEARMLAGAVVMDLAGRGVRTHQFLPRIAVVGQLRPATQVVVAHPQIGQPAIDRIGVDMRAIMARAGQRQLRLAQSERLRRAAFDQRQRLDHLAGRPRKDHRLWVAPGLDDRARRVADHSMTGMDAFQHPAAPEFYQGNRSQNTLTIARFSAAGAFPVQGIRVMTPILSDRVSCHPKVDRQQRRGRRQRQYGWREQIQ